MKKLITLALCALPCVAFADNAKPDLEPILIKQQTVSALPKELYEGWWVTYDVDGYESYALRFYLKMAKCMANIMPLIVWVIHPNLSIVACLNLSQPPKRALICGLITRIFVRT